MTDKCNKIHKIFELILGSNVKITDLFNVINNYIVRLNFIPLIKTRKDNNIILYSRFLEYQNIIKYNICWRGLYELLIDKNYIILLSIYL